MKIPLLVSMEALVHQRKSLVLNLVKQGRNFAWVYITIMAIVICLLTENKSLNLKPIIKMSIFQLNFA